MGRRESGQASSGARSATTGWTTRRWLGAGTAAALVLLVTLGVCGAWILAYSTTINTRLVDRSSPALIAAVRLESAVVNQETGIRGYAITGRPEFLGPYREGLAAQQTAIRQLRVLARGNGTAARDLAAVRQSIEEWQSLIARPVIGSPDPIPLAKARADEGKRAFDSLRAAMTAQQDHLQTERNQARTSLLRVRSLRNWTFSAIAVVILALVALVFVGLRRGVTRHLDRLSADVREVAAGDFTHAVALTGPADLQLLAKDVDAMRTRLAHELDLSEAAQVRLATQTEELRRSNSELEQFAYVASHDLQEPLRKVASFCQLLERRYAAQLDDRARQYIAFAVDGANRMQGLIVDLLAFSRVGRLLTDHSAVDLEAVFAGAMDTLSVAVEEANAVVTHDKLPVIQGERTQLGMLFQNLIANAVKFRSEERPPVIHVGARQIRGVWEFAVSDNGIGIEAEFIERVFVIFQRLHTREQYSGNGIGLALCRKIVEYHGGTIAIDAGHSPGARLVFTLPDGAGSSETGEPPAGNAGLSTAVSNLPRS